VAQQIAKINSYGPAYQVSVAEMENLATKLQEPTMIGKSGGAPTFAVGMAVMFERVMPGKDALAIWYHFAIMFEALFILTTLDAGTRVGRFIFQDFLGTFIPKMKDTSSWIANITCTFLLVSAWGWFLYQGAIDAEGIAKSLWPIFGISNQLLAVIAFSLGTTILIKMGKTRYAWTTFIPLVFLTIVTFTAAIMKLFSPYAAGFIPFIQKQSAAIAAGLPDPQLKLAKRALFNAQVDVAITALFLILVTIILIGCIREWWLILTGRKPAALQESAYIALPSDPAP
jgi:carbon starvation protein